MSMEKETMCNECQCECVCECVRAWWLWEGDMVGKAGRECSGGGEPVVSRNTLGRENVTFEKNCMPLGNSNFSV